MQKNQEIEELLRQLEEDEAIVAAPATDSVKSTPVHNKAVVTLRGNGMIASRRGSSGKSSLPVHFTTVEYSMHPLVTEVGKQ